MNAEEFANFRHSAVHELMRLNKNCEEEFRISSWPRWDYDVDSATLTFSLDGVSKVIASIEVVGTTSITAGTWMWGWANENLPATVTKAMEKVRAFGEQESVTELTQATCPDDEYVAWEMTAIAAQVLPVPYSLPVRALSYACCRPGLGHVAA
jgi:Family of unknown function (DUF6882)